MNAPTYELLLTTTEPLSHHDPDVQDDSNRTLFNRRKQLVAGNTVPLAFSQELLDALALLNPVPGDIADIVQLLDFPQFLAAALVRAFLDMYNRGEGTGVFSGMERYRRLEARARQAAIAAHSLPAWWDKLVSALQVPIHGGNDDAALLRMLSVPAGLQRLALQALAEHYRSICSIARLWHTANKALDPEYAAKAGVPQSQPPLPLVWNWPFATAPAGQVVVEVPAISANSIRHELVREPAMLHLCQALGIDPAFPGKSELPPGVEALLYNGGNIEQGAKEPSNAHALAWAIREAYPSLDLLGGVTDSFDLGESRLRVSAWLVCRENAAALAGSPAAGQLAAQVSACDLLDEITSTRQASPGGEGQMIMSTETLCAGAQILCRFTLAPFTPALTEGALVAALETWRELDATITGQRARGYGGCRSEWLTRPVNDDRGLYEQYLAEHRDNLAEGLRSGMMLTASKVLT